LRKFVRGFRRIAKRFTRYPVNCIYIIIAKCTEKGFPFGSIDTGKDYLAPLITLENLLEIILKSTPPYQK
jgi:hypothetical protein